MQQWEKKHIRPRVNQVYSEPTDDAFILNEFGQINCAPVSRWIPPLLNEQIFYSNQHHLSLPQPTLGQIVLPKPTSIGRAFSIGFMALNSELRETKFDLDKNLEIVVLHNYFCSMWYQDCMIPEGLSVYNPNVSVLFQEFRSLGEQFHLPPLLLLLLAGPCECSID